ncbi:MAG: hydroxymethylglutaryl-CoA lyase [Dehalococcoidia bacterium]|nr:hydroxymethylglutaryl-CoA lyase [Dehalococcoidia bacterium]
MARSRTGAVTIVEVGTRDGFQSVAAEIPTEDKIKIIDLLAEAGITRIEASSFVHPKWVPQLKDAVEVFRGIAYRPGVSYSALIPNERGLDRAIEIGVKEVVYVVSASDSLNRSNFNRSTAESLAEVSAVAARAGEHGIRFRGVVAASFGCPFEGQVPVDKVIQVAQEFQRAGAFEVSLADTGGMAHPIQVRETLARFLHEVQGVDVSVHFHNTLGVGMANVLAAWESGIGIVESSIAGLGGCPYAPGAPGNVPTEGVVFMLHKMGVDTGVNLDKLLGCAELVRQTIHREACD